MKLQIEAQRLRIRIDEDELAQLLAGNVVAAQTQFATAFMLHFTLRLLHEVEPVLAGHADAWQIELPEAAVREHATHLPTREGLRYLLPCERGVDALELLFDVDVRDSVRRRHGPKP
ncbi:MAG: hypothetical protein ABI227_00435 [Rhodanobacter sp.]